MDGDEILLSAAEAAEFLGVRSQTLYAYVSRGLLRSVAEPHSRSRRYRRTDLEGLRQRKRVRQRPGQALAGALHWGVPLLDSELTLIVGQRLFYRGRDAIELAATERFWPVVQAFWGGPPGQGPWPEGRVGPSPHRLGDGDPFLRVQVSLLERARSDPGGYDWSWPGFALRGSWVVHHYLATLADCKVKPGQDPAELLAEAWFRGGKHRRKAAVRLLNAALILAMDHEMNASSFTARVVASAGGSLYEAIAAAMATFSGGGHGGMTLHVERWCDDVARGRQEAGPAVVESLRAGVVLPGFGHPLYPDGDPRAAFLQRLLERHFPEDFRSWAELLQAAGAASAGHPSLDVALVLVAKTLGLPARSAFHLFALGRTAGWVAHAAEQGRAGTPIRPRARYVGKQPAS